MTTTTTTEELEAMRKLIAALQEQAEVQATLTIALQKEVAHLRGIAWSKGWVK